MSLLFPRNYHGSSISPRHRQQVADPWLQPYHQPFFNLFNDTFAELDRLTADMNPSGDMTNLGTKLMAPKFDVKETEGQFLLEGELPGVGKKDIHLDWADDHTLVLKTRTEHVRSEGPDQTGQKHGAANGANPDTDQSQAVTTTGKAGAVTKHEFTPTYHLTERSVGTFQRTFKFPGDVEHENVKANLKNGILTVTVPKVTKNETTKSRSVAIEEIDETKEEGINQ